MFNKLNNTVLCIESEEVNVAVCRHMRLSGTEVLDDLPTVITNVEVQKGPPRLPLISQ